MELLNQIVNAAADPVAANTNTDAPKAHSFTAGDQITEAGKKYAQAALTTNVPTPYRGLGADVSTANNNAQLIREMAGLMWNPVKVEAAAKGPKGGIIDVPGEYWLYKSGTQERIPVRSVTEDFVPHTNQQLIDMTVKFANEIQATVQRMGHMNGGSLIWAVASSHILEDVVVGDTYGMNIVLRSGHGCGVATKLTAQAFRLACSNGAVVCVTAGRVRVPHSTGLTEMRIMNAIDYMRTASEEFHKYLDRVRPLYQVPATPAVLRLALAQYLLTKDEDWAKVVEAATLGAIKPDSKEERRVGADVIERVLQAEASQRYLAERMFNQLDRQQPLLNAVIDATQHQPGAQFSQGTMAHILNGMTYHDSHVRAANRESGGDAQVLRGFEHDNAQGVLELLEQQYVPAVRQVMGRR